MLKTILLLITALTLRPSALGESLTSIGLLSCAMAIFLHLVEHSLKRKLKFNRALLPITLMIFIYFAFLLALCAITSTPVFQDVAKGFITCLFITICFIILFSEDDIRYKFFKLFIRLMIILSVSYFVTMTLSIFIPLKSLSFFRFDIYNNIYNKLQSDVYFPLTPIYGIFSVQHHDYQRFLGLFRESGISQAFMTWAFFSLRYFKLDSMKNKIILIGGILATFSTAGIPVFILAIALNLLFNGRKIIALVVMPMTYVGIMYAPYVGLADKMQTHGSSITDRSYAMSESLRLFALNPFGIGIGNSPIRDAGINLIASLHMIGIIGLLLILAIYFLPMIPMKNKRDYFILILPLFLTALVSQPIIDAPIMFVVLIGSILEAEKNYIPKMIPNVQNRNIKEQKNIGLKKKFVEI